MPELWFEVYCGVCGRGVCYETAVKDQTLTVTCSGCKDKITKLKEDLKMAKKKGKKGCK
jgi:hypothetical protein